ncbi:MAG: cytochrome C [Desulfovibrio sp.]|nr:cytochrome C [Desulfovibrio sp.]MBI4958992.1 cytochrome C [Desulfovibrio sp.]
MGKSILLYAFVVLICFGSIPVSAKDEYSYVGSKSCAQCHEQQYANFAKYSKKAHAWDSIAVMKPKLKEQELKKCYECHTTGYGKKGGFTSKETTPNLADVGCETCHGPGSAHAESGDPKQITRRPSTQTCATCHNPERIEDFRFKPLIFSGAH